ncbi:MAG TPA: ribosome small subunit-dependent GTPase A [Candidatus Treponema faecavium]|nr:ribosome small subunit-dependent GTPase A [Candidatus Treponema faecavium]
MWGTVISGSKNRFEVECADGVVRLCTIKGKILKHRQSYYNPLAPGDAVEIAQDELTGTQGQIVSLVERANAFVRWNVKGRLPQLLAANLDCLLCVTTPAQPPFRARFIDRALAQAEHDGIAPVIVCNKIDLGADDETERMLAVWERIGYRVLRVSARGGQGLAELSDLIAGKLSALVGQSGVGKSSLINALDPSHALRTAELSQKYGRGSHTTTKGVLLHLVLGAGQTASVIDTPGIRRFVLHDIAAEDLALYFKELKPLVGTCAFGMSCSHRCEPGCRIIEAVQKGTVSAQRYESWSRISGELAGGGWED